MHTRSEHTERPADRQDGASVRRRSAATRLPILVACVALAGPWQDFVLSSPTLSQDMIPDDVAPEIRRHIEGLYSPRLSECVAAAVALGEMGPRAAPAAPFLASMLEGHFGNEDANSAGHALIKIGKGAVGALNMTLSATGSEARRRAAYVLGRIGDEHSIVPLVASFSAEQGGPAQLGALRRIGEPAKEYVFAAMKSDDPSLRRGAVQAIVAFSTMGIGHRFLANDSGGGIPVPAGWQSQPVVDALMAALADSNSQVRTEALNSLAAVGASCPDARIELSDLLRAVLADPDPAVRRAAIGVVIRTTGEGKLEVLTGLLSDRDAVVRDGALRELTTIRSDRALDAVAAVAASSDDSLRRFAANALGRSGQSRFVQRLTGLLDDLNAAVRTEAAVGVGKLRAVGVEGRLLKMLDGPDASVRAASVLALGRCGGKDAADALMRLTKSDDPLIRFESGRALSERLLDRREESWSNRRNRRMTGKEEQWNLRDGLLPLGDPETDSFPYARTGEWMATLFADADPNLHAVAAEALIDVGGRLAVAPDVLLAALKSPDEDTRCVTLEHMAARRWAPDKRFLEPLRQEAIRRADRVGLWGPILLRMGETEYVIQRCAAIARDHEPNVAGGAIRMLADMGDAGMDVLFGILGHSRRELRDAAARALAARADHPRVKEFVRSAAAGADERQRAAALLIVGRSAAPRKEAAPQLLVEALRPNILDCADQNRRKLLAMGTNATPAVLPLLKDPNSDVRAVAAGILGELGDKSALPALAAALGDEATTVRALAAETLGLLGDRQAAPALAKAVADRDPAVGESALASLSLLDTPAGWDAVLSAAASDDWRLRRAAAEGLGRCRDKRATDALARAVSQDTHWAVRRAAADSLGRTGIDAHVPFLIEALRDRHWFVSYAAHQSLRTIAKRDMEPDPELWRSWWEQNQKAAPAQ